MRIKEEVVLGALLFLSSFIIPNYFYFAIILVYALASYLQLRYFPPFVSAILLIFSPFHSFLVLLAYPLLFVNRRYTISFLLSILFTLLAKNYLVLLLSVSLEKRGLIASGILFLILSFLITTSSYGELGYFLIFAGVISAVIEEKVKISLKTSAVVYLSSLALIFKTPYIIPALTSFSPLTALLFSPFYPFFSLISLKYVEKKIKGIGLIPSLASLFYPPLALSPSSNMIQNNSKIIILYYVIPFAFSLYFFGIGNYDLSQFFTLSSLFLIGVKYGNYLRQEPYIRYLKQVGKVMLIFYPYIISAFLLFIASYFYFYNVFDLAVILTSAIVISFPVKVNPYGLAIGVLSLINPLVGISSSMEKFSFIFLVIPLIGVIFFHFSSLSWIFYAIGVVLYMLRANKNVKGSLIFLLTSIVYFAYSIYLFFMGDMLGILIFSPIAITLAIIFLLVKYDKKFNVYEIISYLLSAFPMPILALPFFFYLHKKLGIIGLIVEVIITVLLIKYVSYIHVILLKY